MALSVLSPAGKSAQVKTAKLDASTPTATPIQIFGLPKDSVPLFFTVTNDTDETTTTVSVGDTAGVTRFVAATAIGVAGPFIFDGATGAAFDQYTALLDDTIITTQISAQLSGIVRINCFYFVTNRGEDSIITV